MAFLLIYITHENEEEATKIVDNLLKEKLVACGNCFPIKSMYWWQGEIAKENEWVSILKTIPKHWEKLCEKVEKWHPYEVPCILKIEAEANVAYEDWIRESVL